MTNLAAMEGETRSKPPAGGAAQVFYRFEDENGTLHLSDSLSDVPLQERAAAERVELGAPRAASHATVGDCEPAAFIVPGVTVHWPSFGLGLGLALVLLGLGLLGRGRGKGRLLVGALSLLGLLALGVGLYLGALRRMAGTDGGEGAWLSSPTRIIDDAKRTVEQVELRRQEQETLLEQIKRESR